MLPQPFGGIELRGIGRQRFDFQPGAVLVEPRPDVLIFMVGGVILNQNGTLPAITRGDLPLQEIQIGLGIKHLVSLIKKAAALQFNSAQNLHAFPLPGNRHLGRVSNTAPSRMNG